MEPFRVSPENVTMAPTFFSIEALAALGAPFDELSPTLFLAGNADLDRDTVVQLADQLSNDDKCLTGSSIALSEGSRAGCGRC